MWFWLACVTPEIDAETELRHGRLTEAIAAWEAGGGRHIPSESGTAQTLAKRAQVETWITMPVLVDFTEAAAVLDGVKRTRNESLDVSFERWAPMAACTTARLQAPWRVAVGRSTVTADPDPLQNGRPFQNVPYSDGRVLGGAFSASADTHDAAAAAVAALFASIDKNPPAHRVTVVLQDGGSRFSLDVTRRDGVWWSTSASDAAAAADWVVRCGDAP